MPKKKFRPEPQPGSTFKKDYLGTTYSLAVVEQNGRVVYRVKGRIFDTPTAAAKSVTNTSVNGWIFWSMDKR